MDAFARGLKIAAAIRKESLLDKFIDERYQSWDIAIGADIEADKAGFNELSDYMLKKGEITPNQSGRLEMLENIINEYIR